MAVAAGVAEGNPLSSVSAKAPMAGTQAPDWCRFKIGSIEATVVSDGVLPLGEASNLVVEAPVAQFTKPIEE